MELLEGDVAKSKANPMRKFSVKMPKKSIAELQLQEDKDAVADRLRTASRESRRRDGRGDDIQLRIEQSSSGSLSESELTE